jgi:hypothetical protein
MRFAIKSGRMRANDKSAITVSWSKFGLKIISTHESNKQRAGLRDAVCTPPFGPALNFLVLPEGKVDPIP